MSKEDWGDDVAAFGLPDDREGGECPNCKGTGYVDMPFSGSDGICPCCHGDGVTP